MASSGVHATFNRVSVEGVESIRADRAALLELAESFSDDDWARPSDCTGWSVKDVVAHMAATFRQIADPASLPATDSTDVEANQELYVAERKDWSPAKVLAEYVDVGEQAIELLAGMQTPEMAEVVVPLGSLGSHPLPRLADALAFDHYTHIRVDLLAPTGPLDRPAPPSDELRLVPTIAWMTAGLPQMASEALVPISGSVSLHLEGPGGGSWRFAEGQLASGDGPADASVASTTAEFVVWATHRRPWRERGVGLGGDETLAARFCDAVHVF
jgi:uncharacterized protein (TIGR03083 family)